MPPGYVYIPTASGVTYGQPKELAVIRARLTAICTGGRTSPGSGPAVAEELIQVGRYALAEGSCGNPELHAVLRKTSGQWRRAAQGCGTGGGVIPDYGRFGLRRKLLGGCAFPPSVVDTIVAIRSRIPFIAREDARDLALQRACAKDSQVDVMCPGYRFTAAQQRSIDYNRYFGATVQAVDRGDFAAALAFARQALRVEPRGMHDQERRIAELEKLIAKRSAGEMSTAQAIAEWRRLGI